jgi:polyribonucleotide nucleotidyltransferase
LSDIPFDNPIAGVRIGLIDGKYLINPTYDERRESALNLVVAGTEEAIVMVEAEANEVAENIMVEALMLAHKEIKRLCLWQRELFKALDIQKREFVGSTLDETLVSEIETAYTDRLREALDTRGKNKLTSYAAVDALKKEVVEAYATRTEKRLGWASFLAFERKNLREDMLGNRRRPGRTQILGDSSRYVRSRLAAARSRLVAFHARRNAGDCRRRRWARKWTSSSRRFGKRRNVAKRFMLHYNFPPYSVGETGASAVRRAAKSDTAIWRAALCKTFCPTKASFPYTIRIVSEITESNGSVSMATSAAAV